MVRHLSAEDGMVKGSDVAYRVLDADTEQIANATDVAAGCVDLGEDVVGVWQLRIHSGFVPGERRIGRAEPGHGLLDDEQVC